METGIFRSYDVRGVYPDQIDEDTAKKIGNAAARFLDAKTIIVGEDGRISSPQLSKAVIEGANMAGCDIVYIGRSTTPMFYYAVKYFNADGGIMVTASHNPSDYNGLKITARGAVPIGLVNGLNEIKQFTAGNLSVAAQKGVVSEKSILNHYVNFLSEAGGAEYGKIKLKIVVDAGNGVGGLVMGPLADKLNLNCEKLFFEPDGRFPNRSPDPLKQDGLSKLREAVKNQNAALGIAFDGDADRLAVIDEKGEFVPAQYILGLLWQDSDAAKEHKIVYDIHFSKALKEFFGLRGAVSRVGHTFVAEKMRLEKALLGGETSGHFFFRETNYNESAILAALKLLKIIQTENRKLSELVQPFKKYFYSGEITIPIGNVARQTAILEELRKDFCDFKIDKLDGLTVEHWDENSPDATVGAPPNGVGRWWFNVRPSNTEPALRMVVEADNEELMNQKIAELKRSIDDSQ